MSHGSHRKSGTPTFIAASARQSSSGLDSFPPITVMDPSLLDAPDWYSNVHNAHPAPLSPQHQHEHFSVDFGPGFASHGAPVSHEALQLHRKSSLPLSPSISYAVSRVPPFPSLSCHFSLLLQYLPSSPSSSIVHLSPIALVSPVAAMCAFPAAARVSHVVIFARIPQSVT
jgi:hypothetical protein